MRIGSYRIKADWGHLALVAGIAGFCLWYLSDARAGSTQLQNMLLIMPMSLAAVLLALVICYQEIKITRISEEPGSGGRKTSVRWSPPKDLHIPVFMILFGIYVFAWQVIGFDVATFLFVAISLAIQKERNWLLLVVFSLVFSVGVTWAFKQILSVPVPTVLFGGM